MDMENRFRLIAMLLQPEGNYTIEDNPQAVADFEKLEMGDENSFEILQKYEVDSDHYMEFDTIADYVIDEDADGFYLFEKVVE
jgi:hypothetical protein